MCQPAHTIANAYICVYEYSSSLYLFRMTVYPPGGELLEGGDQGRQALGGKGVEKQWKDRINSDQEVGNSSE